MRPPARHRLGRRFRHSLKWRLVALFLLLAAAMAAIFIAGSRQAFGSGWREVGRPLLADYVDRLVGELGSPPDRERARALAARLPLRIEVDGPGGTWSEPPGAGRDQREHGHRHDGGGPFSRLTASGDRVRLSPAFAGWEEPPRWIGIAALSALLLAVAAAFAYVRRLLGPVEDIGAGALRFGSGDFSTPIPVRRRDELGDLAQRVNTMAEELGRTLEGQRALLLAISHELRSPLTRARLNAELVGEGAARDALLRDLQGMARLIGDLLESERLATGSGALQREPTQLDALVRERVDEAFADRRPQLALGLGELALSLDRTRISLVLRNLLDNAWRHSVAADGAPAPPPVVRTEATAQEILLSVRDFGPGVTEAQMARLAQPFYRTDEARSRHLGGVGLGLALSRLVARSHGGDLRFRQAAPGLEVILVLPRA